jgi:hypothetical protein
LSNTWGSFEYDEFWSDIATELWMINRLVEDFALWDLGLATVRTSADVRKFTTKRAFDTVKYLTPWIFVATYKILEVIHKSTRDKSPITLQRYPALLEVCEMLRESFRRARNKIVHTGSYGVWAFPSKKRSRLLYDKCLVVLDENHKRVIKISVYDVVFAGVFAFYLSNAIKDRRLRDSSLQVVYYQVEMLREDGWIDETLFRRVEQYHKALRIKGKIRP